MTNIVSNVGLASIAQQIRDHPNALGVMLLTAVEADDALRDHTNLQDLLNVAGNTEATDPSAGRKTGLTGTVTLDHVNNRVDCDLPDQLYTALSGANIVAVIVFIEESASDAGRVFLVKLDWSIAADGSNVTLEFQASGFHRSSG